MNPKTPVLCIILLFCYVFISAQPQVLKIEQVNTDYFIGKKYATRLVDSTCKWSWQDIQRKSFQYFNDDDLRNRPQHAAHWVSFRISTTLNHAFTMELYDFNIDEVQVFFLKDSQLLSSHVSGFQFPFVQRYLLHKNLNFELPLKQYDTLEVLMRFKSDRVNVLEPVIRSTQLVEQYGLTEYLLIGFFYGLAVLIILFNGIYFLILRNRYYLYYVFFVVGILIYLMSQNGTGFQYLWPKYPFMNVFIDKLSLSCGIIFMLLFSQSYLELKSVNSSLHRVIKVVIFARLLLSVVLLFTCWDSFFTLLDFMLIQLSFSAGIIQYQRGYRHVRWYIAAFSVLNVAFLLYLFEYLGWLTSSAFSVYALNGGIILQFILLTIGLAESVRKTYAEKNEALSGLLEVMNKAENNRLVELKRQMNPHFIFNALNSILHRIRVDKKDDAAQFLVQFSRLIRKILEGSDKIFTSLEDEIYLLKLYIEIESMRLGNAFKFDVRITGLEPSKIQVPTFIIQPLLENAIWHGLIPKEGEKILILHIYRLNDTLVVEIEDNGIGRKRAMERKGGLHKSKGLELIRERLNLIQLRYKRRTSLQIEDMLHPDGAAAGTKIVLEFELEHEN